MITISIAKPQLSNPPEPISLVKGASIQGVSAVLLVEVDGSELINQSKVTEEIEVFMRGFLHELSMNEYLETLIHINR